LRPRRLPWSELLKRVFALDILQCQRCLGRMTVMAFVTDPEPVRAILDHLHLPSSAPTCAPARAPPEPDLFGWDQAHDTIDPPSQFE
jgi:hypothetical protein